MGTIARVAVVLLVLALAAGGGYVANRTRQHLDQLNGEIATLQDSVARATEAADVETERAEEAERSATEAMRSRESAEDDAAAARQQALVAGQRATQADDRATAAERASLEARAEARQAQARAEQIRQAAEAEMNRLTSALGRIAETRRTALGLVMSLDEGYLKFDFDKTELRPESRELLSRIAGILFTANDFSITVSGHTDARGTERYNQELSEQRARAVADYLIEAGLPPDMFTVQGFGKAQLLDPGDTAEAHARNRRVEIGMVNARIVEPGALP